MCPTSLALAPAPRRRPPMVSKLDWDEGSPVDNNNNYKVALRMGALRGEQVISGGVEGVSSE